MNRCLLAILLGHVCCGAAIAQTGSDNTEQSRRGRAWDRGRWMGRMLDRAVDDLQLDESQRKEFDEIASAHRKRMEKLRPQWDQIRQARREGNDERVAELREQMTQDRGPQDSMREAFDEVELILDEQQYERFRDTRNRNERRREQWQSDRRMTRELPDELSLDETQRMQFDELLASRRGAWRQRMSEMRPLWEQMREARESGDEDRLAELRTQLEGRRLDPERRRAELLDEMGTFLHDDQKPLLAAYLERIEMGGRDEPAGAEDVRLVLRAATRVRLSSEQRVQLRVIGREAIKSLRNLRRRTSLSRLSSAEKDELKTAAKEGSRTARDELRERHLQVSTELAAKTKANIVDILDSEQNLKYEEAIQELGRHPRRK